MHGSLFSRLVTVHKRGIAVDYGFLALGCWIHFDGHGFAVIEGGTMLSMLGCWKRRDKQAQKRSQWKFGPRLAGRKERRVLAETE